MRRAKIIATGSYAPDKVMTNHDMEKFVDTTDEWIVERTGIKERHVADKSQAASDLAYEASKKALKNAGLRPRDIDMIILATCTGDSPFPSTACVLQAKLGAKKAFAFDINAACSGFLYGLSIAENFIKTGAAKKVLLVGAEVLTKFVDWEDRSTCVLFGDGAGAAILEGTDEDCGIIDILMRSDGTVGDLIHIPGGGSRMPTTEETLKNKQHVMKMKGNELFKVAVKSLEGIALDILKRNDLTPKDVTLLIPHQANLRIIQATAKRLKVPMDDVFLNLERYGNTSAASIPIALDEAIRTKRVRAGDTILFEAIGAGVTWASALIKW